MALWHDFVYSLLQFDHYEQSQWHTFAQERNCRWNCYYLFPAFQFLCANSDERLILHAGSWKHRQHDPTPVRSIRRCASGNQPDGRLSGCKCGGVWWNDETITGSRAGRIQQPWTDPCAAWFHSGMSVQLLRESYMEVAPSCPWIVYYYAFMSLILKTSLNL